MIAYSSRNRKLEEVGQFKANEFFNWIFYVGPIAVGKIERYIIHAFSPVIFRRASFV